MLNDLNRHHADVFDLLADPAEQTPLEAPAAAALRDAEQGREWLKAFRAALPTEGARLALPPEVLAKLRSLGYVGGDEDSDDPEAPAP